jgi:hypothetical protein
MSSQRRCGLAGHPRANAVAERWVKTGKTGKTECPDWLFILGERHLVSALTEYVEHYNRSAPTVGLTRGAQYRTLVPLARYLHVGCASEVGSEA